MLVVMRYKPGFIFPFNSVKSLVDVVLFLGDMQISLRSCYITTHDAELVNRGFGYFTDFFLLCTFPFCFTLNLIEALVSVQWNVLVLILITVYKSLEFGIN